MVVKVILFQRLVKCAKKTQVLACDDDSQNCDEYDNYADPDVILNTLAHSALLLGEVVSLGVLGIRLLGPSTTHCCH